MLVIRVVGNAATEPHNLQVADVEKLDLALGPVEDPVTTGRHRTDGICPRAGQGIEGHRHAIDRRIRQCFQDQVEAHHFILRAEQAYLRMA